MSYAVSYQQADPAVYELPAEPVFVPRSRHQWIPLTVPILLCGLSWLMGGAPALTDLGFALLTLTCIVFLLGEFVNFPRRFGIGGMLLYGGVLIWFCHDYFSHWFGITFNGYSNAYPASTVAKAAFYHCVFILCMCLGLNINRGRPLERLIVSVPEPANENVYLILVLLTQMIGFSPFFLFTLEPFYTAIYHGATSAWTEPVRWSVSRTGNLNYNWGAYVAQLLQAGQVGGLLAATFALLVSRHLWSKLLAWLFWAYWLLYAINGIRRGDIAFMMLPPIALLFIKYQASISAVVGRQSLRAYVVCGGLVLVLLVAVQAVGSYRGVGLDKVEFLQLNLLKNQGNSMFSEGLKGWDLIPDTHQFFHNTFPGEGLFRALPEEFFWFAISPIPRALWNNKPVDPLWEWYNKIVTGDVRGYEGTTISKGLVGSWYFNYGVWGVLEGGLLVGWLMGICERAFQRSGGRPMGMLMSLGFGVWLFRTYRDFIFIELYAFIVGAVAIAILVYALRPFTGSAPSLDAGAS
jgi:hypothetical protein